MNNIIEKENIESIIYEIRGKQVMLDSDLARLYHVETKRINEAVRRNKDRFPERFSWQLSKEEEEILRSQIATSSLKINSYGGRRYNPRVFTEQGVAMLATILKSDVAVRVSIAIMDAFVAMRHYLGNTEYRIANLETKMIDCDNNVKQLQLAFDKFKEKDQIYLNATELEAYSEIINICKNVKQQLIIVDRYIDNDIFSIINRIKCNVLLITSKNNKISTKEIHNNLKVYYDDTFHDRYIIIDNNTIYHSGNSINHIGYRKSSINLISDNNVKQLILNDIHKIID